MYFSLIFALILTKALTQRLFFLFCGGILVRIRAIIEKKYLFGRALIRTRAKIEKNTTFGSALVRMRAKIETTHILFQGLG